MSLLTLNSSEIYNCHNLSPELTSPKSKYDKGVQSRQVTLPSISSIFPNHFHSRSIRNPFYCKPERTSLVSLDEYNDHPHIPIKGKRKRANSIQINHLNKVFETTAFPSTELRNELGRQLGMSPRAVQIWFQNKRQSLKGQLPHGDRDRARRISISLHSFEPNLLPVPIEIHNNMGTILN